jgi:cyclic 2,3-diphosphoglycerate synthase
LARRPAASESGVADGPVIALIDGEHHPAAVREVLDRVERERGLAGVVFCGGEEKLGAGPLDELYGRHVEVDPPSALRMLAPGASAVVDLADEPILDARHRFGYASLALHLGLVYELPGARLDPPAYAEVRSDAAKLAVIGTGKRTGKTAVAGHWAALLQDRGADPVMVCMGRGGPAEPRSAPAGMGLAELLEIDARGEHAASDYLEDAVLAGVRTVGCRRVGGGLTGEPAHSNVLGGASMAASMEPGVIVFEGSGACIPPVAVDRTVCVIGPGVPEPFAEYRILRADLILAAEGAAAPGSAVRFSMAPEPAEPVPEDARVALFTTGAERCEGVEPLVASANLARRARLAEDLDRAAAAGCDLYLTELKAAAIDTVARRAQAEGARVAFVRNRPLGVDEALLEVWGGA